MAKKVASDPTGNLGNGREDFERLKAEAEVAKAHAEAAKAQADALKSQREAEALGTPGAREKAEAENRKAIAEAEKDAATARRDQFGALVPDLGAVRAGTLDATGDEALFGVVLRRRALAAAAKTAGGVILQALQQARDDALASETPPALPAARVLVTNDPELVDTEAVHLAITGGAEHLTALADQLLTALQPDQRLAGGFEAVAGAVAAALPAALSLVSAQRTLAGSSAPADEFAATASVVGALVPNDLGASFALDEFRTLSAGTVQTLFAELEQRRQRLLAQKLALSPAVRSDVTPPGPEGPDHALTRRDVQIGLVDAVAASIDAFVNAATTVPAGATRSLFTLATMRERLHAGEHGFTHVLLIRAGRSACHQVLENRPLWLRDRFAVAAGADISFALIRAFDGAVVCADQVSGQAQANGTIGRTITLG